MAVGDVQIRPPVHAGGGIDQPAVGDVQPHARPWGQRASQRVRQEAQRRQPERVLQRVPLVAGARQRGVERHLGFDAGVQPGGGQQQRIGPRQGQRPGLSR